MATATPKKGQRGSAEADAYCPHCHLLIDRGVGEEWPPEPQRCPHCRLLVGTGRARPTPAAVFAHEAKRSGKAREVSTDEIRQAICAVAEELGARPERLLMVDYQQRASDDDSLPALSDVFAAFGSWKRARRAAAA